MPKMPQPRGRSLGTPGAPEAWQQGNLGASDWCSPARGHGTHLPRLRARKQSSEGPQFSKSWHAGQSFRPHLRGTVTYPETVQLGTGFCVSLESPPCRDAGHNNYLPAPCNGIWTSVYFTETCDSAGAAAEPEMLSLAVGVMLWLHSVV